MAYIVDIAEQAGTDPSSLDALLDPLYLAGYMSKSATVPNGWEMVNDFVSTHGTSPAYLIAEIGEDGFGSVSLAAYGSPTANRVSSYAQMFSFDQALRRFADGNLR